MISCTIIRQNSWIIKYKLFQFSLSFVIANVSSNTGGNNVTNTAATVITPSTTVSAASTTVSAASTTISKCKMLILWLEPIFTDALYKKKKLLNVLPIEIETLSRKS